MNLRSYQADTIGQALARVRRDLGPDAVVLHTRTIRTGGFLGFGAKQRIEITASNDVKVLHPRQRSAILSAHKKGVAKDGTVPDMVANQKPLASGSTSVEPLRTELSAVRSMVEDLVRQTRRHTHPEIPQELFTTYLSLLQQEVAGELAEEMIRDLRAEWSAHELSSPDRLSGLLASRIEQIIPTTGGLEPGTPGKPRVVALIGPTGVGKTTTIAKLAANFKLRERKRVGLITIDTYRIAAVDQLRTYAGIIDVPLRVVLTPSELTDAINQMNENHFIFVDTAGRSPNNDLRMNELKSFLEAAHPHEVHLVLACTASQANMLQAVERFEPLGVNRIIFTKLDEAVHFGVILNVLGQVNAALSYITTGQSVPDDIEVGQARRLARMIIDSCRIPPGDPPPESKTDPVTPAPADRPRR